jgi:hypothetical protein
MTRVTLPAPSTTRPTGAALGDAWGVLAGCALVFAGFFLPWLRGDGAFALRSFSGLELAALLHNVVAALRVGPPALALLLLYLLPAAAAGAAVLSALSRRWQLAPAVERLAVGASGAYALVLLAAVLLAGVLPGSAAVQQLGPPSWGFGATALGALLLLRAALAGRA